jgi:hypothetical protein
MKKKTGNYVMTFTYEKYTETVYYDYSEGDPCVGLKASVEITEVEYTTGGVTVDLCPLLDQSLDEYYVTLEGLILERLTEEEEGDE